jgi:phosphoglucosamine mutase
MPDAVDRYLDLLIGDLGQPFAGMTVALDCANGAAHLVGPRLFRRLGAEVEVHAAAPDGMNINEGWGATHPETLAGVAGGRVGFCLDGDADRLIAVDEDGEVVNGDGIMAVLARHMQSKGELAGDRVVGTVMSNLGFRRAMSGLGIDVVETQVGDRYVLEAMVETGACLGGEQSGHVVFEDHMSGDGLRTAIRLAEVMQSTGAQLRELRKVMAVFPQVLVNVVVADRAGLDDADEVWAAVAAAEASLAGAVRVLVRPSGTEPLVRVMVEASTAEIAQDVAARIAETVTAALG